MKYIFKNIKNFYKQERLTFFLTVSCIFFSALILNLSYGIYHQFERTSLDEVYGTDDISADFNIVRADVVTKKELDRFLPVLEESIGASLNYVAVAGYLQGDQREIDYRFEFVFYLQDGEIKNVPVVFSNMRASGLWKWGSYFTDRQYEDGELVALAGADEDKVNTIMVKDEEHYKYRMVNRTVTVAGKEYCCIGGQTACPTPMIPYTTAPDSMVISRLIIGTHDCMTKRDYTTFVDILKETYGDAVTVEDYPIPDTGNKRLYRSVLVICILIAAVSAVIYAIIYQYILCQRKKMLFVFRLCGLTGKRAKFFYMAECMLFAGISYGVSLFVFHHHLLPRLGRFYGYMEEAYSLSTYAVLAGIYFISVYVMLNVMIDHQLKQKIADGV